MPGSTRAALQDAEGVNSQNYVAQNTGPLATNGVPSVVPDLPGADVESLSQNLVVSNEPHAPASGEGE